MVVSGKDAGRDGSKCAKGNSVLGATPHSVDSERDRAVAKLSESVQTRRHGYPYQLSKSADVTLTIYDIQGRVVRALDLGHRRAGMYQTRTRAAYWDGKNDFGEQAASGVYFYTVCGAGELFCHAQDADTEVNFLYGRRGFPTAPLLQARFACTSDISLVFCQSATSKAV